MEQKETNGTKRNKWKQRQRIGSLCVKRFHWKPHQSVLSTGWKENSLFLGLRGAYRIFFGFSWDFVPTGSKILTQMNFWMYWYKKLTRTNAGIHIHIENCTKLMILSWDCDHPTFARCDTVHSELVSAHFQKSTRALPSLSKFTSHLVVHTDRLNTVQHQCSTSLEIQKDNRRAVNTEHWTVHDATNHIKSVLLL